MTATPLEPDAAILEGLARRALSDVHEAINDLETICRWRMMRQDLCFLDAALVQLRQASTRLRMGLGDD